MLESAREAKIKLPCVCASMRRATRAATRLYDRELRGTGLRSTQFTLLQALDLAGEITQGRLGSILGLDTTTLTRSLGPLIDAGWVKSEPGDDRRERNLRLATSGSRKLQDTTPAWNRAQSQLKNIIGRDWDQLERDLLRIAGSAA